MRSPLEGHHTLPLALARLAAEDADDRPVPSLGLGDQDAAIALLEATRAVLLASNDTEVVAAVGRFGLRVGGWMVPAALDAGTALPLDVAFGTGPPVLFDADQLSLERMRLEQFLPMLVEDARMALSRLRHLEDVQGASGIDPLTGLLSRRELMRRMPGLEVGDVICLLDIDHFKAINDRDGHVGGDLVLRDLGQLIGSNIRERDCAGRYGGDELVLLLKSVPEPVAVERLSRLQQVWSEGSLPTVTFSAGAAALDHQGWEVALAHADAAMYVAKQSGRNRSRGHSEVGS
jgi:diguanylate cyclase (GGDEF)-like protein